MMAIYSCIQVICLWGPSFILDFRYAGAVRTIHPGILWPGLGMALLTFSMLCILMFFERARAYSANLLIFDTCLLTCQIAHRLDTLTTIATAFVTTPWPTALPPIESFTPIDMLGQTLQDLLGAFYVTLRLLLNTL